MAENEKTERGYRYLGKGAGPGGECVCPECGYKAPHTRAEPCYKKKCEKCSSLMVRGKENEELE